jgi:predicted Ser/Thr protein kinase
MIIPEIPEIELKIVEEKILGRGSCGSVYETTWRGGKYAVKRLELIKGGDTLMDVKNEANIAYSLNQPRDHPNIIKVRIPL